MTSRPEPRWRYDPLSALIGFIILGMGHPWWALLVFMLFPPVLYTRGRHLSPFAVPPMEGRIKEGDE